MAYLYVRKSGRVEIREAHATPRGPRSRTLVSFRGPLTDALLDRAAGAAQRGLDREAPRRRAAELGVPVLRPSADAAARALIGHLRRGARLDPVLAGVLAELLAERVSEPVPEALDDAVEWIGATDAERGRSLVDVLRLYDRIARSRDPVREPERPRYPRFEVRPERRAS